MHRLRQSQQAGTRAQYFQAQAHTKSDVSFFYFCMWQWPVFYCVIMYNYTSLHVNIPLFYSIHIILHIIDTVLFYFSKWSRPLFIAMNQLTSLSQSHSTLVYSIILLLYCQWSCILLHFTVLYSVTSVCHQFCTELYTFIFACVSGPALFSTVQFYLHISRVT